MEQPSYWFPAKRHGWGWGPPTAWQGWLVLAVFFGLLAAGAWLLLPGDRVGAFAAWSILLSVVLVAICKVKGEPPTWRSSK